MDQTIREWNDAKEDPQAGSILGQARVAGLEGQDCAKEGGCVGNVVLLNSREIKSYLETLDSVSSRVDALTSIISHEIGHLLGVGHRPGTIMDAQAETNPALFNTSSFDSNSASTMTRYLRCADGSKFQ
ncbi:MAG: hypothetical protein KBG15_06930 [Kofleriaceae bacterium]|nr:hypothetical protein [Kofleriaceae bacterium]